jgi:mannan endo-1,4-beta-mannosidase
MLARNSLWRHRLAGVLTVVLLATLAVAVYGQRAVAHTVTPVNPQASADTRKVLDFLAHVNDHGTRTTQAMASGFFAGYNNSLEFSLSNPGASYPQVNALRRVTGKWPFVLGCDYAVFDGVGLPHDIAYQACNGRLRSWWRQGGLASVSIHLPNPFFQPWFKIPLRDDLMQDVLNPNSAAGLIWRAEMRVIADGLQQLGVPVLFRPLHEMNANWFWWGSQSPATYAALWRSLYNYITVERRLTNVIWVYAPNFGRNWNSVPGCGFLYDSSADNYYPGSAYVDVVGLDAYLVDPETNDCLRKDYQALIGLGKPFAFTEIGRESGNPYCTSPKMDYRKWMNALKTFRETTYFLAWNDCFAPQANHFPVEFMGDPVVLNRGDRMVVAPATPPPPAAPSPKWKSGFTSWNGLGGGVRGKVASVELAGGNLQVFARGTDDRLYTNVQTGGTWGGWQGLGDALNEPPTVMTRPNGVIEVFYRGLDTRPYMRRFNGSAWEAAVRLGEVDVEGQIAAVPINGGAQGMLFIRHSNGEIYFNAYANNKWNNWVSLGGDTNAAPAAIARDNGAGGLVLEVYARWADDNVRYRRTNPSAGGGFEPWVNLGGVWKDVTPVGVTVGVNHSMLFGIAQDNTLHFQEFKNGDWLRGADGSVNSGWRGLGGSVHSQPTAIAGPGERVRVFTRDANQQINAITWWGGSVHNWEKWASLSGETSAAIGASRRTVDDADSIDLFGIDTASAQPFHTIINATVPTLQLGTDTDATVGEQAMFVVTGPPGAPVSWSSTRDGAVVENHAFYDHYLDANGEFVWYTGEWTQENVGSWVRQAHVGTETVQTIQLGYRVSERPVGFTTNKTSYWVGENITYAISGRANQPIYWTSTVDGQPSGETNAFYNQYTGADGAFTFTSRWTDGRAGSWVRQISVGGQTAQVAFTTAHRPATISTDKGHYRPGENVTYTITGPPNEPISWSSWVNGRPSGENSAFYGHYTDDTGAFSVTVPWTDARLGIWTKFINIAGQPAQVQFAVSDGTVAIYTDSDSYGFGSMISYMVTGPANQPTFWTTWRNGSLIQNNVQGPPTDANGMLITEPAPWTEFSNGTYVVQVGIGGQSAQVTFVFDWPRPPIINPPITATHSNKCLDVEGNTPNDGARVLQATCPIGVNTWRTTGDSTVIAEHSGKCLEVTSGNIGAPAQQSTCNGNPLQRWQFVVVGDWWNKLYKIVSSTTGMCLAVAGASQADGAEVVQWPCENSAHFIWHMPDPVIPSGPARGFQV